MRFVVFAAASSLAAASAFSQIQPVLPWSSRTAQGDIAVTI